MRIRQYKLTPKREKFAQLVANGNNYTDAYRQVYSYKNMKPSTVNRNAFELAKNSNVSARIEELRSKASALVVWDLERAANELIENLNRLVASEKKRSERGYCDPKAASVINDTVEALNKLLGIQPKDSTEEDDTITFTFEVDDES